MQKNMQNHAAVFRTEELMQKGISNFEGIIDSYKDIKVSDHGKIWNTDVIEALELDNLLCK
jgi:succinate dehydrogenase/fumarate reductase flavoprotein subunit